MVLRKAQDVFGKHRLLELQAEDLRIIGADLEADGCPDVAEHGITQHRIALVNEQLSHVLVRHGQTQAVLARLGEDGGKGLGGEVLELIHVEVEIFAVFLRNIRPAHGIDLEFGHEHGTDEGGSIFSQFPLAQVHENDLAGIHGMAQIDGALHLSHNVSYEWRGEQLAHFVLDGSERLCAVLLAPGLVLVQPEALHERIAHPGHDLLAVRVIRIHPHDAEHGSRFVLQKRQ